jgi:hypothetical protein
MRLQRIIWFGVVSTALLQTVFGQGFANLNFEQATVPPTPVGGFALNVNPTNAFPGWTVAGAQSVCYNDVTLGNTMACLIGPDFPNGLGISSLQGSYSAWLLTYQYPGQPTPSLSQTAMVPSTAQSISFLAASEVTPFGGQMSLGGVAIPLVSIGGGRLAGDISAFAGQVEELTFSGNMYFDDIQFSSSRVPEPGVFSLFGIAILLVGWRLKRLNKSLQPTPVGACSSASRFTAFCPARLPLATPHPFPAYTPGVWPGMAMGYLPFASGMAGGLESQV